VETGSVGAIIARNLLAQRPVAGDLCREWRPADQLLLERQGGGQVIADMELAIAKALDKPQPPHVPEPADVRLHDPAVRIGLEAGMDGNRVDPAGLVGDPRDRNVRRAQRRLIGLERHHGAGLDVDQHGQVLRSLEPGVTKLPCPGLDDGDEPVAEVVRWPIVQQFAHDRHRMVGAQKKLRQPTLDFRFNCAGDVVVVGHRPQALYQARCEPPSVRGAACEIPGLQPFQTGSEVGTRRIERPGLRRQQQLTIERGLGRAQRRGRPSTLPERMGRSLRASCSNGLAVLWISLGETAA